jgi:methyl-accepting chemotaxis protein
LLPDLVTAVHTTADQLGATLQSMNVAEDKVQAVVKALHGAADELSSKSFEKATIGRSSFGATSSADSLGLHHDLAHQVMSETLQGMVTDLTAFSANVTAALKHFGETDQTVADDMTARREIVEDMTYTWQHSHADAANHEARNHQHPSQVRP